MKNINESQIDKKETLANEVPTFFALSFKIQIAKYRGSLILVQQAVVLYVVFFSFSNKIFVEFFCPKETFF